MSFEEIDKISHAVTLYHFIRGQLFKKILENIVSTVGVNAPSYSVVKKWTVELKWGRESLKDNPTWRKVSDSDHSGNHQQNLLLWCGTKCVNLQGGYVEKLICWASFELFLRLWTFQLLLYFCWQLSPHLTGNGMAQFTKTKEVVQIMLTRRLTLWPLIS